MKQGNVDKLRVEVSFSWVERNVKGRERVQQGTLRRRKVIGLLSQEDCLSLVVRRSLDASGKPFVLQNTQGVTFKFYRQREFGHQRSWAWVKQHIINHVDYLFSAANNRGDLAEW